MSDENSINEKTNQGNNDYTCNSFHGAIEFIGKRWMGMIIYRLLDGPKRYHELLEEIHGISDRLLSERLRELVEHGLVYKNVSPTKARKVEYELTESGLELKEIMNAIVKWVEKLGNH